MIGNWYRYFNLSQNTRTIVIESKIADIDKKITFYEKKYGIFITKVYGKSLSNNGINLSIYGGYELEWENEYTAILEYETKLGGNLRYERIKFE